MGTVMTVLFVLAALAVGFYVGRVAERRQTRTAVAALAVGFYVGRVAERRQARTAVSAAQVDDPGQWSDPHNLWKPQ